MVSVAYLGEGSGRPEPPLILCHKKITELKEGRQGRQKKTFPPTPQPLKSRSGSASGYNCSYIMMAKPMKTLELHYSMMQILMKSITFYYKLGNWRQERKRNSCNTCTCRRSSTPARTTKNSNGSSETDSCYQKSVR